MFNVIYAVFRLCWVKRFYSHADCRWAKHDGAECRCAEWHLCWESLCWTSLCWVSMCWDLFMLWVVVLNIIMLSVNVLRTVYAESRCAEHHYAECHCAENCLCWVSIMLSVNHAEYRCAENRLCSVLIMLSAIIAFFLSCLESLRWMSLCRMSLS